MTEIELANPLFKLYSVLNEIANSIIDVNYRRANENSLKERQWWFPEYPESNDENYPRGVISFSNARVSEYGTGQYVNEVLNDSDNVIKEQYGQYLTITVSMPVYVKKDQMHTVVYLDGTQHKTQNRKLADYMIYQVHNAIRKNKSKLVENGFSIEGELIITPSFDDNHFLFAADISFDLVFLDVWNTEYDINGIIQTINYEDMEVERTN